MKNVYDILVERGFVSQVTEEEPLRDRLQNGSTHFYIGFDPTADSLHAGSLVPIMAMMHMQRQGHLPIVLLGGGTGLIAAALSFISLSSSINTGLKILR